MLLMAGMLTLGFNIAFNWGLQAGWVQGRKALRAEALLAGAGRAYLDERTLEAKWEWLTEPRRADHLAVSFEHPPAHGAGPSQIVNGTAKAMPASWRP